MCVKPRTTYCRGQILEPRPRNGGVEAHDDPVQKCGCERVDAAIAIDATHVGAGQRRAAEYFELDQERVRVDRDVNRVGAVADHGPDLRLADLMGGRRRRRADDEHDGEQRPLHLDASAVEAPLMAAAWDRMVASRDPVRKASAMAVFASTRRPALK